jgi:metal-responsive CopG/Arc/MetJ family transcriptional regulator
MYCINTVPLSINTKRKQMIRNQILGIRSTKDFVRKFDSLCDRLGCNRSQVIRYALHKFFNEHYNNPANFNQARQDLF